jgi:hypothetical protein
MKSVRGLLIGSINIMGVKYARAQKPISLMGSLYTERSNNNRADFIGILKGVVWVDFLKFLHGWTLSLARTSPLTFTRGVIQR